MLQKLPNLAEPDSSAKRTKETTEKEISGFNFKMISEINEAMDRFKSFGAHWVGLKYSPLRQDVIDHCQVLKIEQMKALNYDKVEKLMKNRIQKMMKNRKIKKNWSQQDIMILIWIVSKYADSRNIVQISKSFNENDWSQVASLIPGVNGQSCMFKWLSLKRNKLSQFSWSQKESVLLNKLVKKNKNYDWNIISQQLYFMNNSSKKIYRFPKQCREHWNCYLNPNIKKGPWTQKQDLYLMNQIKNQNGQKKWAQMVKKFDGRTENALKNRFNLLIQKQKNSIACSESLSEIEMIGIFIKKQQSAKACSQQFQQYLNFQKQTSQIQQQIPKRVLRKRKSKNNLKYKQQEIQQNYKLVPFNQSFVEEQQFMSDNQSIDFSIPPLKMSIIQEEDLYNKQSANNFDHFFYEEQNNLITPILKKSQSQNLPEINKIKMIPIKQEDMMKLKEFMKGKGEHGQNNSFIPCKILDNKLTKIQTTL